MKPLLKSAVLAFAVECASVASMQFCRHGDITEVWFAFLGLLHVPAELLINLFALPCHFVADRLNVRPSPQVVMKVMMVIKFAVQWLIYTAVIFDIFKKRRNLPPNL
jgi:hypothetical protein